jgi:hypothetical protein
MEKNLVEFMNFIQRMGAHAAAAAQALILLLWQPGVAQAASAADEGLEELYRRGLQALAEQDLPLAEALLKRLLRESPHHAGAWMDLAVLYCHLGDEAQAKALWDEVEVRFAPPGPIRELIGLLRQQGCQAPEARPGPDLDVQIARGHASNVNQGVRNLNVGLEGPGGTLLLTLLPEYAPRADSYTQTQLSWRQAWPALPGLSAFAQWQARRHDSEHAFDLHDVSLGLGSEGAWRDWRWRWQGTHGALWLDDKLYQRSVQVQMSASPPWQPWPAWRWGMEVTGSALSYPTLTGFDTRLWEGRASIAHTGERSRVRLHAGLAWDDGSAQRPGGDRSGWHLGATWRATLPHPALQPLSLEAGLSLQRWRGQRAYAPGLIDPVREQRTHVAWAALTWSTGHDSAWVLEARRVRNDENIGLFAYDAVSVQLGWQRRWQPGRP